MGLGLGLVRVRVRVWAGVRVRVRALRSSSAEGDVGVLAVGLGGSCSLCAWRRACRQERSFKSDARVAVTAVAVTAVAVTAAVRPRAQRGDYGERSEQRCE